MAHESSFTLDDSGNVSSWRDPTGRYPALSADPVGQPAGRLLSELLDHLAARGDAPAPAALLLSVGRHGTETVVDIRGTAPSLRAAHVEAAFEYSAFEQSTAGLEMYDTELRVLRSNSAALAMRGRPAGDVLEHRVADLGSRLPLPRFSGRCWTAANQLSRAGSAGTTVMITPVSSPSPHFGSRTSSRPSASEP